MTANRYWCAWNPKPGRVVQPEPIVWIEDDGAGPYRVIKQQLLTMSVGTGRRYLPEPLLRLATLRESVLRAGVWGLGHDPAVELCDTTAGEYYPRVARPRCLAPEETFLREFNSSMNAARNLFAGMADVFRYVEPSTTNEKAYGHQIRQLLILACTEVEAQCKAVLRVNGYPKRKRRKSDREPTDEAWNISDFAKLEPLMRLSEWSLDLAAHEWFVFNPFDEWRYGSQLSWYSAYNQVKHDREMKFQQATLENLIEAMGAVFVLIMAQFGQWGRERTHEPSPFVMGAPGWKPSQYYVTSEFVERDELVARQHWSPA